MSLKTPLTPDEVIVIAALRRVRYPAASWDKRFANQLSDDGLTEKQRPQVWRLFIRYRRQIDCPDKARILAAAEKLAAPDFRKVNAAANEQARIDELKRQAADPGPCPGTDCVLRDGKWVGVPLSGGEGEPGPHGDDSQAKPDAGVITDNGDGTMSITVQPKFQLTEEESARMDDLLAWQEYSKKSTRPL